ncbi:SDR family NAD(P)-dependent oxidoreductase [Jiangella asiatica]|uniref:SDR family NAD(P)-dependent oxidoreductase n=1 Tax=Jiangella asiatica TaxID=2530372 RepID=A0A4R5CFZ2_9ACTN|nr:SDR family NAD(P)-dependent oxidoreductase [Jiangella asiatica]TDD99021.1 SDR family NAD(P)-dependent oxidoreductase [Jiangella asiatica]
MIDTGLAGKVVVVTGADRGIGAATATAFAALGARVAVHYFTGAAVPDGVTFEHADGDAARAERLAAELARRGAAGAVAVADDLAHPDAVVFLASDHARWITGQVLRVAGGHVD